ncbi:MAG: ABC transporter substrate-binding protein [Geopsychrobacter sp.]|nr:ABC transporter substrate-binding protein [Geopsychrobacter sp.]
MKLFLSLLFLATFVLPFNLYAAKVDDLSPQQIRQLGERMYREGVLPNGEPIQAFAAGDIPVEGTSFTCISCHLRSGLGAIEGTVISPPATGKILYEERTTSIKGNEYVPSYHSYAVNLPPRPAYTDETLAKMIASGVDPNGRSTMAIMPRFQIDDENMAILIAYLKTLSAELSVGATKEMLHFATVIVDGTDPAEIESMVLPLQFSVDRKNSLATASKNNDRIARMAYNMLGPDLLAKRFSLERWVLKGPSSTWRAQLEAYYKANPVFALLGGISHGDWAPVHRFCEDKQLPDIFPQVDYPVLDESSWQTIYLSRGIRQEGEAAARYLAGMSELFKDRPVIQVSRNSRRGSALKAGFNASWAQKHKTPVLDISLPAGVALNVKQLSKIIKTQNPAAVVVWDDASALPALQKIAQTEGWKGLLLTSGTWLGDKIWTLPADMRKKLYLTWPYRLPHENARFNISLKRILSGRSLDDFNFEVISKSYITNEVLGKALKDMRGEYYRDFFLDSIDMLPDTYFPLYERLSFGQGQRFASKGCFIVQLGKGENPQLERRSEWVTR